MNTPLLHLEDIHTHIGQYHILQGVSLNVMPCSVTVLMGRNGAGKTTTMRTIMGLWRTSAGRIRFEDSVISEMSTPEISKLGIAYVPEDMAVFTDLTVKENLTLAAINGPMNKSRLDWICSVFPPLQTFWLLPAGNLSGGQKQMLAIARAVIEPRKLLLIDEPSKGLAPSIVNSLLKALNELKETDTTILLVEQNFQLAKTLADNVAVMDDGRIIHSGRMKELAGNSELQISLMGLSMDTHQ